MTLIACSHSQCNKRSLLLAVPNCTIAEVEASTSTSSALPRPLRFHSPSRSCPGSIPPPLPLALPFPCVGAAAHPRMHVPTSTDLLHLHLHLHLTYPDKVCSGAPAAPPLPPAWPATLPSSSSLLALGLAHSYLVPFLLLSPFLSPSLFFRQRTKPALTPYPPRRRRTDHTKPPL